MEPRTTLQLIKVKPVFHKNGSLPPPSTYQDWLDCFEFMKSNKIDQDIFSRVTAGTFDYEEKMKPGFQQHLLETVNFMLNKYSKRFSRNLNELVEFNEIADLPLLFQELKRDINYCLFFNDLDFLGEDFKNELRRSVEANMSGLSPVCFDKNN